MVHREPDPLNPESLPRGFTVSNQHDTEETSQAPVALQDDREGKAELSRRKQSRNNAMAKNIGLDKTGRGDHLQTQQNN